MKTVALIIALLLLAGCGRGVVIQYVPVEVERIRYVAVPAELTNPHPIAEGSLSQCPDVAAQRAVELRRCNVDKAAIREIGRDPRPPND